MEVDRVEARGVEGRTELQLPECPAPLLLWPVHQLAGLVITMASWISDWPGAQLLTGRPQIWVVPLLVLGLLPWLLGAAPCYRRWSLIPMATALLVHGPCSWAMVW